MQDRNSQYVKKCYACGDPTHLMAVCPVLKAGRDALAGKSGHANAAMYRDGRGFEL